MKKRFSLLLLLPLQLLAQSNKPAQPMQPPMGMPKEFIQRMEMQAKNVTIIRDNWGIPHVYGRTDADAVFGLLYAQCEDDFKRVEMNYIEKLGRMSEIKGESELYNDLLIRMIIDSAEAINDFRLSPPWMQKLLLAYADGINYYLYKHPEVKPALLTRFEPWYPLLWTDGSIGAIDIGGLTANDLKSFYSADAPTAAVSKKEKYEEPLPSGSNGFAFAPSKTASGNTILYINPHVTFYFRPEVAVESMEGLHAYGAVTWGQFFIYQGFNEHCGWMHTSSNADVADVYLEKVTKKDNGFVYEFDKQTRPLREREIIIKYLNNGVLESKKIKIYYTHHGPVMGKRNGQWASVKANNRSLQSLIQSWQRTKAKGFEEYKKTMELFSNTSNNTVYADDKGNIAYWHGNYMPKRDPAINWSKPVDGSIKATEYQGLHKLDEIVHVYNPSSGWIQNCNSTPYTVSGASSPKKESYPRYMAPDGENFRGINAAKLLNEGSKYTIDKVIETGYNKHLAAFDVLIPALVKAYQNTTGTASKPTILTSENYKADSANRVLGEPIKLLSTWDKNSSENSIATTLAIEWAQKLMPSIMRSTEDDDADQVEKTKRFAANADPKLLLQALSTVISELTKKFGHWQVMWGDINRYQRLTGNLVEKFDDTKPSIPSGFAASTWGCLPSFVSRTYAGTNKRYGYNGNSFICAVEFGKRVTAKSLLAGGESGDVNSKHFGDQALMYTKGQFKEVLFYKEDVMKHVEKTYHPGE